MPDAATTSGTRCTGTPRKRSYGISAPSAEQRDRCGPGRASGPAARGATRCPARRSDARAASDAAGDGGIGVPSGMTREISDRSRRPRSVRKSCSSSAVSLGAGGHLNGVDVTADDDATARRSRRGRRGGRTPRPRCRTRGRPRPARAWPPGARSAPSATTSDVGLERSRVGLDPSGGRVDRLRSSPGRTARPASRCRGREWTHRVRRRSGRTSRRASRSRRRSRRPCRSSTTSTRLAELVGQPGRQLEPAEPRAQHQDLHGRSPSRCRGCGRAGAPSEPAVGVEPTTYRLQGDCSDQLSYTGAPASYGGSPTRSPATHRLRGLASSRTCWNVGRLVVRIVFGIRPGTKPVRGAVLRHADGSAALARGEVRRHLVDRCPTATPGTRPASRCRSSGG